jgi:hypothetical protein
MKVQIVTTIDVPDRLLEAVLTVLAVRWSETTPESLARGLLRGWLILGEVHGVPGMKQTLGPPLVSVLAEASDARTTFCATILGHSSPEAQIVAGTDSREMGMTYHRDRFQRATTRLESAATEYLARYGESAGETLRRVAASSESPNAASVRT